MGAIIKLIKNKIPCKSICTESIIRDSKLLFCD